MNIGINTKTMSVSVIQDKKIVKKEDLTKDSLKELMSDLCDDELLNALRFCSRKLGSKKFLFKDVK